MTAWFGGRLSLVATILIVTAHRLPAPISEVQSPTPAHFAKSDESKSAGLPRLEVTVGKIKDIRVSGGEVPKMEVEFSVSAKDPLKDVQGFRIAIDKATDDTGLDLVTPHSNGREFEGVDSLGKDKNFKQEFKSPHRNAATIHELTGNVELFVPKKDPTAMVVISGFQKHLGTPINSDTLKSVQLQVVVRTARQYAALRKEHQVQQAKTQHKNQPSPKPHFNPISSVEEEPNNIAVSSQGVTANLVDFEFRDQADKPIDAKRRMNIYEPGGNRTVIYHFNSPPPETTELVLLVSTPGAVIKVPFA